eukprot:gene13953-19890_t
MSETQEDDQEEFTLNLDSLVTTHTVQVVQSWKNFPAKKKTPAEILAELSGKDAMRQLVDQLVKDNAQLMQDVEELKSKAEAQEEINAGLSDSKADKDQLPEDLASRLAAMDALEERVALLEASAPPTEPEPAAEQTAEESDGAIPPLSVQQPELATAQLRRGSDEEGGEEGGEGEAPVDSHALELLVARVTELENRQLADKNEVLEAIKLRRGLETEGGEGSGEGDSPAGEGVGDSGWTSQTSSPALAPILRANPEGGNGCVEGASKEREAAGDNSPSPVSAPQDGSFDPSQLVDSLNSTAAEVHALKLQIGALHKCKADVVAMDAATAKIDKALAGGLPSTPAAGAARSTKATPGARAPAQIQQNAQSPSAAVTTPTPGDDEEPMMELGGSSTLANLFDDPAEAIAKLKERMDELELAMSMKPANSTALEVNLEDAQAAVDGISSLEELLPKIKEIYTLLDGKATGAAVNGLKKKTLEVMKYLDLKVDEEQLKTVSGEDAKIGLSTEAAVRELEEKVNALSSAIEEVTCRPVSEIVVKETVVRESGGGESDQKVSTVP